MTALLTAKQLAEAAVIPNASAWTLLALARRGAIPSHRLSPRRILFDVDEVRSAILASPASIDKKELPATTRRGPRRTISIA